MRFFFPGCRDGYPTFGTESPAKVNLLAKINLFTCVCLIPKWVQSRFGTQIRETIIYSCRWFGTEDGVPVPASGKEESPRKWTFQTSQLISVNLNSQLSKTKKLWHFKNILPLGKKKQVRVMTRFPHDLSQWAPIENCTPFVTTTSGLIIYPKSLIIDINCNIIIFIHIKIINRIIFFN